MKKTKTKINAFTLVELIIVITILTILATISFMSFQGYIKGSRDSNRLTDVSNIKKGLELYSIQTSHYPKPDIIISTGVINGQELTYVGEFGEINSKGINLNTSIKDPLTNTNYTYGTDTQMKQYQIASIIEGNTISYQPFIETLYADSLLAKVDGNYKGYIKFSTGGNTYIANIPSLLFNNIEPTINLLSSGTYYIVNNKQNLPYNQFGIRTDTGTIQKVNGNEMIIDLTNSSNSTLTGIEITNITEENFSNYFSGDILESFNILGNIDALKTSILGGSTINSTVSYNNCTLAGETITHGNSIIGYSEVSIAAGANYDCASRAQVRTCNNGVLDGDIAYQYSNCVKGAINNCIANSNYSFNGHTFSLPNLNHGNITSNIESSNISENNGVFTYMLTNIECNDGVFINANENGPIIKSCNTGYGINGNVCSPSQNGVCNNTIALGCTFGNPINDNGNTTCGNTRTWNCSGLYNGNTSSLCSFNNGVCDTAVPVLSSLLPSGTHTGTTTKTLTLNTNETATCKYHTGNVIYDSMPYTFINTNSTSHNTSYTAKYGTNTIYVRCMDTSGNKNTTSGTISFKYDTTAPAGGNFTIPVALSNTTTGTLNITCPSDISAPVQMYIDGTGLASGQERTRKTCTSGYYDIITTTGAGNKEINIKFKDAVGNETTVISNTTELITTAFFTGSGTSANPRKVANGMSLKSCQEYNLGANLKNDGTARSTGTCGNGTKACLTSGIYSVAPDMVQANSFPMYCDMTVDGGGWGFVVGINGANRNHINSDTVTASNLLVTTGFGKYTDGVINSLYTTMYRLEMGAYKTYYKKNFFSSISSAIGDLSSCTYAGTFVSQPGYSEHLGFSSYDNNVTTGCAGGGYILYGATAGFGNGGHYSGAWNRSGKLWVK